jgi:ribosomal protein S18 acetylase RimI-like enzyme
MTHNDLLIKLYELSFDGLVSNKLSNRGVILRKPIGPDRSLIISWAHRYFPPFWIDEIKRALGNTPASCWIAQQEDTLLGFACYDATLLGFFGPVGVIETARGEGIGSALTKACLHDMLLKGYGYAIVGRADNIAFYRRITPHVIEIPGSDPGIYRWSMALKQS